jgi:hypothetical protein
MNASGSCSAPVVAVATGISPTSIGGACSQGGVPGTWGYLNGSATIICVPFAGSAASTTSFSSCVSRGFPATWMLTASGACISPVVAAAPVAIAPATGAGSATTSIQFGAACSISGMAGTYQYAGGTATLVCTPYATTTAVTAPSTVITTRSCTEDGFPATWLRTATGACAAPIVETTPVATAPVTTSIQFGAACTISGMAGTYQYAGGTATLVCTPYATTTAVTAPSTVITTTPVATTTPATSGTRIGGSCSEGGISGTYGYVGGTANIACIPNVTATTVAPTATTTAPTSGGTISPGMACFVGSSPGTYQYSGGASLVCVA